ncbi:MAG: hypothetical protein JWP40_4781 [Blastococcus sp.]|nr:hypothetical protein [Blastococcus sp.]
MTWTTTQVFLAARCTTVLSCSFCYLLGFMSTTASLAEPFSWLVCVSVSLIVVTFWIVEVQVIIAFWSSSRPHDDCIELLVIHRRVPLSSINAVILLLYSAVVFSSVLYVKNIITLPSDPIPLPTI